MTGKKRPLSTPSICCQADRAAGRRIGGCRLLVLLLFGCAGAFAQPSDLPRLGPPGVIWEAEISRSGNPYERAVEALLAQHEGVVGLPLAPGSRGAVGIKVNTRSGKGLSTPTDLLSALIDALERRGFTRDRILIIDYSAHSLREAQILPPLSQPEAQYEGAPVLALDSQAFYEPEWFYDSPLPPAFQQEPGLLLERGASAPLAEGAKERKSYLPIPLLFDVDFWINAAVATDDRALGLDGALSSATLWNVSNSRRFLANGATAASAVAEIAAIPELRERMVLHFMTLERYQFIGGPFFNSRYTRSEPLLWLSSDPVAIDRLIFERMNKWRLLEGFPEIRPVPRQFAFAERLGLGISDAERIRVVPVRVPADDTSPVIEALIQESP